MPLHSRLFRNDVKLERASVSDPDHVLLGAAGPHVHKVQSALAILDNAAINPAELASSLYGRSTARAVLAYKKKRRIINFSYQTQADDIVGKMTIAALDREMLARELLARPACNCGPRRVRPLLAFSLRDGEKPKLPPTPPVPGATPPPPPLQVPLAIQRAPDAIKLAESTLDAIKPITSGTGQPADAASLATRALQTHYLATPSEVRATALLVKGHLEEIIKVLQRASSVFVLGVPGDPDGEGAYAYSRHVRDGKIYVNPSFLNLKQFGRKVILLHEAFHSLSASNVDWCRNPDNDGGKGYRQVPKDLRPMNAYVISQLVIHLNLKAEKTLDVETDEVADLVP